MARTTPVNSGYTIINGSTTGSNGSKVDTWLEYKVTSQSVTNNTSTVRVVLYSAATFSSTTKWDSASQFGYVGYDNANKQYLSTTYNFANYAVNKFGDHTYTIQHNNDGTKTVTLQGSWSTSHSTYISGGSASGSVTLPQIARASSVSAMSTKLGSMGTITITRQSSSFTHTLTYTFGNASGTIATKTSATSVSWTPPVSLISQITNATSGTGTITCETFSGNTSVGTSTSTLTLSVPNSTIANVTGEIGISLPFTVTNTVTSQLTFTITYTFGNASGTIQTKGSRTGNYTYPTSLISQISGAAAMSGTITVTTFNGTAQIGTSSATLRLLIPTYKSSAVSGTIGTALTISLTRPNSSLSVTITYSFGSTTGTIISRQSVTSTSWTPPTSLINEIPNSDSGGGTITLTTYNGTVNCGSNSYALTLAVPSSVVPTSSFTTYIVNNNSTINGWGVAVQGYSQIRGVLSANGIQGSTIKTLSITGQGLNANSTPDTSSASLDQTSSTLTTSGSITYYGNATDSRNRSATQKTSIITVYPYAVPSVTGISIIRVDAQGNADSTGQYLGVTFTSSYSSVGGHNTCTIRLQYKENTASSWSTDSTDNLISGQQNVTSLVFDVSKNFNTRLQVTDALNTTYSVVINVASAERVLNINQYGDGLAIGGFSTLRDYFQVYYKSRFGDDVTMLGDLNVSGNINGYNLLNGLVYKGTLTSSDDLNNITESGIYYINDPMPSNCPTGATYSKLFVTGKDNVPTQIIFRADASSGRMWIRIYGGNPLTWRAWRTFTDIDSTNALIYRGTLTSADDLNDIKDTGVYFITDSVPLNAPSMASTYTIVLVIHPYGNFVQQFYYHTHLTQGYPQFAVRQYSGSTPSWDTWRYVNDMPYAKAIRQIVANDDLNNFTDTGVYYCSNSATTQSLSHSPYTEGIWVDGTTGFRLEVYNTTGTGYGFQIMYTHNVTQRTYIRSLNGSTWRAWHRIIGDDEIYYRVGETTSPNAYIAQGYLSESSKRIRFQVHLSKSTHNTVSGSLTACKINAYHSGGGYCIGSSYVSGGTDVLNGTGYTTTIAKITDYIYRVQIDRTTAFNGANNSPVIVECNAITFSFS